MSSFFKMFWIYVLCAAADFASSMPKLPSGFHESNAMSRHLDGSFWPLHALANFAFSSAEILCIGLGIYAVLKVVDKRLAWFVAGLPWIYFAYGHLEGAFANMQVKLLYIPFDAHINPLLDFLNRLVS